MGDHAGNQTPRPFIDPSPEESAPKDADEADQAVAVRQSKKTGTDQGGRKEFEPAAEHREQQSTKREFLEDRREDDILECAHSQNGRSSPHEALIKPFRPVVIQIQKLGGPPPPPSPPESGCDNSENDAGQASKVISLDH